MHSIDAVKSLRATESFGSIDADADQLLKSCFQDHPAYRSVHQMKRFVILGRKGSGKTAIYKKVITENEPDSYSFGYSFDDYPWHHHNLQSEVGVPEERKFIHSWKYLILLGLAKILLNNDRTQPWDNSEAVEALSALEDFVVDSYGTRDPDMSQLFSPRRKLHFKGGINAKFFQIQGESVAIEELPKHIQDVNRAMEKAILTALNPNCRYYICFDQLDLGYSPEDKAYSHRLIGLLIAARDLFVKASEASKSFNPVVFLRDDIFEELHFEDKNKITDNYATWVTWDEDKDGGLTLRKMMERRFAEVLLPRGAEQMFLDWNLVFDEQKEMPGHQSKYKHICDRTFLRPRDMIKFCNEVLEEYKRRTSGESFGQPELGHSEEIFINEDVHAAREDFSNYLVRELDDEISKHVPRYEEYLEVLKTIGSERFNFSEFEKIFNQRQELKEDDPWKALDELFKFSIISYLRPGGRGGGSEYVWRYRGARARLDPTVDSFRVHPGLKETLGLTRQYGTSIP